jgi:hypothetical protein
VSAAARLWRALRAKPAAPRPPQAEHSTAIRLPQAAETRPKLVASNPSGQPMGSIPRILTAALEPSQGGRVEIGDAYRRYAQECAKESKRSVSPDQFVEQLDRFCKGADIRTKTMRDGQVYLLDVRLVRAEEKLQADAI